MPSPNSTAPGAFAHGRRHASRIGPCWLRLLAGCLTALWFGRCSGTAELPQHWAYQPLRPQSSPNVATPDWPWTEVDRFLLKPMEDAGLRPSPDADRATLCRRLHFDLIGLPPSPEALDRFVSDPRPESTRELVDRLLASPQFGEHWARRWFDVARFAESVTLRGFLFKEAWRYRDYVIDAFNEDRPIADFYREQLAGDLLPGGTLEERQRRLVATTFLTLGNTNWEEQDKRQMEMDIVDEQLDVIGKAMLGQTVACARCHDHKFDPIPTRDYYALAGILKNSLAVRHANLSEWIEKPLPLEPEEEERLKKHEAEIATLREAIQATKKRASAGAAQGSSTNRVPESSPPAPAARPTPPEAAAASAGTDLKALEAKLKERLAHGPKRPMVMAPAENPNATNLAILRRGSVQAPGEVVPRGFLTTPAVPVTHPPTGSESGRRELADWITDPRNPLTSRVFVNRVWLWLMGEGLVQTPDNFGTTGSPPTHPELLDTLAAQFAGTDPSDSPDGHAIRAGSLKSLVRSLVLSRAYQLESSPSDPARQLDPENRLGTHAHRKRLTAEQIRDAILAVSGRLDLTPPRGPTYPANRSADYDYVASEPRRSVYVPVFRNALPEVFNVFDFPPTALVTGLRSESSVASQALFLLNDPFVREHAEAAATRITAARFSAPRDSGDFQPYDINARLNEAYLLTLSRRPTDGERQTAQRHFASAGSPEIAWTELMHALISSPDFRWLD